MKKYLFIVLLVFFWSCDIDSTKEVSQDYLDLEWFYWCGRYETDWECGDCELYAIGNIDTSGTILGEQNLSSIWFENDREYIRWFENEKLLIYKDFEQEEDSIDIQAYIDARHDSLICFWFNEK